jgi:hypothetical protein
MQDQHERWLNHIYQQWMQGQDGYMYRWLEFVKLTALMSSTSVEVMEQRLKKYRWFRWY